MVIQVKTAADNEDVFFCHHCYIIFTPEEAKIHDSLHDEYDFVCPQCKDENIITIQQSQFDIWCELTWLRKKQNAINKTMNEAVKALCEINDKQQKIKGAIEKQQAGEYV